MRYPNFREEKRLKRRGFRVIAGLDESGRGPLAGPVVAAAVCLKTDPKSNIYNLILNLKDSKKLTPKKREEIYRIVKKHPQIKWATGRVGEKVIDRINIKNAAELAMERAVKNLEKKFKNNSDRNFYDRRNFCHIDFLVLDGNSEIDLPISQKAIVKADEKVFSCALASIVAKVSRDRMMIKYHKKYPRYCFDKHKGYPTKLHRRLIKKYGPSVIHRKTFHPIKKMIKSI